MNICQTVVCTCILHNICILQNDRLDDIMNVDPDDGDGQGQQNVIHAQGALKSFQIIKGM